jgi:hypothetical protein
MKLLTLAAACAALTTFAAAPAFAASAFAGDPLVAKLQSPVGEKTKIIAGGAMFVCEAGSDACIAAGATSQTLSLATCKTLSAKVGTIVSFERIKKLDDDKLADCNAYGEAKRGAGTTQLAKQ